MSLLDSKFDSLFRKLNRMSHYVSKFENELTIVDEENEEAQYLFTEVLGKLRCEGFVPSHQDIFFLRRLLSNNARIHNLAFLKDYLEFQQSKIYNEIDQLYAINSKCDNEVIQGGTT